VGRAVFVFGQAKLLPLVQQRAATKVSQLVAGQVVLRRSVVRVGSLEDKLGCERVGNHRAPPSIASEPATGSHVMLGLPVTVQVRGAPFLTWPACRNSGSRREGTWRSRPARTAISAAVLPGRFHTSSKHKWRWLAARPQRS